MSFADSYNLSGENLALTVPAPFVTANSGTLSEVVDATFDQ